MKISNQEIESLPFAQFDDDIVVVDSLDSLKPAIDELNSATILGFDTETRPAFTRGTFYHVALLQLSTEHKTWPFRLNKIGLPQELADVMANPNILKVGLAIRDDLRALIRRQKFTPANCVDIQPIASSMGIEEQSLKKLAAQILGVRVSKRQRLSNWENDSLSLSQQLYAATDSWISLLLYLALQNGVTEHPRLTAIRAAAL